MSSKLYVGNLSVKTTNEDLYTLFATVGNVKLVLLPTDHQTGTRKNYGFVEMETIELAHSAVLSINGHKLHERNISVTEINPPEERRIVVPGKGGGFRPQKRGGWGSSMKR